MLWLCLRPQHLARDALALRDGTDTAITQRRGQRTWIVDSTCGLTPGIDLGSAMALRSFTPVPRDPQAEAESLRQLATLSYALGSPIHVAHEEPLAIGDRPYGAAWVEIGASLYLFGGLESLLKRAREMLAQQSMAVALGVAPTLEGASMAADDNRAITSVDQLKRWLGQQPLSKLRLDAKVLATLRGFGTRQLDELYRLPTGSLKRRFGAPLSNLLARLAGDAPDVRQPFVIPDRFRRRFELFGAVENIEGLLIPLRRLFVDFAQYLRVRDTGAQRFQLVLKHENHARTPVTIELVTPSRNANHFLMITREKLARVPIRSGITELVLRADHFSMPDRMQLEMFESQASSQREWTTLMERLTARWGSNAAWTPSLLPDHRPELCWAPAPPGTATPACAFPPRPHWLLEKPRIIGRPSALTRAERLQGHWWPAQDRDYHLATARDGTQQWVYQDRANGHWYIHGLWG